MQPPEVRRLTKRYERRVDRELRKDRPRLLRSLAEFANMRSDAAGWAHFRNRWPDFFPTHEYDRVVEGLTPSIEGYLYWLDQIWRGGETNPYLHIMLGIIPTSPFPEGGTSGDIWEFSLQSIRPNAFFADWDEGKFWYEGGCDFHRALYLLFRESWRARICERCDAKFIATRAAQKYCPTDCSEAVQRDQKRTWWDAHGNYWRKTRNKQRLKKGVKDGSGRTR